MRQIEIYLGVSLERWHDTIRVIERLDRIAVNFEFEKLPGLCSPVCKLICGNRCQMIGNLVQLHMAHQFGMSEQVRASSHVPSSVIVTHWMTRCMEPICEGRRGKVGAHECMCSCRLDIGINC